MIHIASVFDTNYLARALVMYRSLIQYLPDARFHFLCLDTAAQKTIQKLDLANVIATDIAQMNDPELMATRGSRTPVEFAMSAKPAWIAKLISSDIIAPGDQLILVDVDIMFYEDPKPLLARLASHPISITPHRFPKSTEAVMSDKVGIYNSGLIFFTKMGDAVRCAQEWRLQCIKWCSTTYEPGLYTDQRYLNDWHHKYTGIYDIPDKGVNAGTWNIATFSVQATHDRSTSQTRFLINGDPLICYHFHGLKLYFSQSGKLLAYPITIHHGGIYALHLRELGRAYADLEALQAGWTFGTAKNPGILRLIKQTATRMFRSIMPVS
ncbi:MAG TPA: glycosyltransferase [Candidatus Paceibacterota bacterium]